MSTILRRSFRLLLAATFSLGLLFVLVSTASAHAKVDSAMPGINSTITTAPTTVTVHTAENMKTGAQNSNLFVYGPSGDLISKGNATVSISNPQQMSVTITPEKADGVYVVRWITVSADDGDPDQGAFIFTVKSGASVTPTAAVTPIAAPNKTTTTTSNNGGLPAWVAIATTGVVALIVGAAAGFGFGRSRTATIVPPTTDTTVKEEKTPTRRP